MITQEINSLYEELESILVRKFPPEEYGEDADLSSICTIAQELRDELLKCTKEKKESKAETVSVQMLRLENRLLWKFVAEISDQHDTYNGKVAYALLKRFKKNKADVRKSRMRLPSVKM